MFFYQNEKPENINEPSKILTEFEECEFTEVISIAKEDEENHGSMECKNGATWWLWIAIALLKTINGFVHKKGLRQRSDTIIEFCQPRVLSVDCPTLLMRGQGGNLFRCCPMQNLTMTTYSYSIVSTLKVSSSWRPVLNFLSRVETYSSSNSFIAQHDILWETCRVEWLMLSDGDSIIHHHHRSMLIKDQQPIADDL